MEQTIKVEGMMCGHCEAAVKKAMEGLSFIAEATPDREKKIVTLKLSGDFDEAAVKKTIEDLDYKYLGAE